jgi:hypothetical protein
MSADNGIYILPIHYPNGKTTFLVNHCQAIDNIEYTPDRQDGYNNQYVKDYFINAKGEFDTKELALNCADEMYEEIMNDDFGGICEYGISTLNPLIITTSDPYPFWNQFGKSKVKETNLEVPPEAHLCKLEGPWNNYGPSIEQCWTDSDDYMWAGTEEYLSQVNYCPICGMKAPVQIKK